MQHHQLHSVDVAACWETTKGKLNNFPGELLNRQERLAQLR